MSEPNVELWKEHWQDEGDAAYLYRVLAGAEPDPSRAGIFRRLAEVEDRHVRLWREVLEQHGERVGDLRPSLRARALGWLGRRFGPRLLLPLLLAEEGREMKGYLGEYRAAPAGTPGATALRLARESAQHAETLGALTGRVGEPWHRTESGGFLRNVVYGFNDGLTANFGLVMGVVGAAVPHHIIVISGVAGCVADALSMGSSGYLAAKSEREAARAAAAAVMKEPERALAEKAREELGITQAAMSPLREGWVTGVATAFGALIPILPFFAFSGRAAIGISFAISMASHFGVGGARSVFTGRGVIRSGFDMFVVGLGVAAVGYVVGTWITEWL